MNKLLLSVFFSLYCFIAYGQEYDDTDTTNLIEDFTAYPNPFNNKIVIEFDINAGSRYKITLCDLYGRMILEKEGGESQTMELETRIQTGVYIFSITSEKTKYVTKIIKQ